MARMASLIPLPISSPSGRLSKFENRAASGR
jgi:hypothetical protein